MEEPTTLAERVTQWHQEALDEGRRQGMSEGVSHELQRLLRLVDAWPATRRNHPDHLFIRYGLGQALAVGRFIRWVEEGGNWAAA